MDHLAALLDEFGYLAILIGTFLEGETILALGGFAAHQGYLRLDLTILAAFAGSAAGDQFWFLLARWRGRRWLAARPDWQARLAPTTRWLERYPVLFVLGFRFIYGIRNIAPVAIGLSAIPTARFILLNLVAAALWAVIFGSLGYLFGEAIETLLGRLHRFEHVAVAGLVFAIGFVVVVRWFGRRLRRKLS